MFISNTHFLSYFSVVVSFMKLQNRHANLQRYHTKDSREFSMSVHWREGRLGFQGKHISSGYQGLYDSGKTALFCCDIYVAYYGRALCISACLTLCL